MAALLLEDSEMTVRNLFNTLEMKCTSACRRPIVVVSDEENHLLYTLAASGTITCFDDIQETEVPVLRVLRNCFLEPGDPGGV